MSLFKKTCFGFLMVLAGLHFNAFGFAADWINPGEERFFLGGGIFLPNFDTKLRVDDETSGTTGTNINLEDDLDFNSNETTFWVGGYWRFAAKHRLAAGYLQLDRDATATTTMPLVIGDEVFPPGTNVMSDFKLQILPISYAYSFFKREKFEFAGSLGLHWTWVDFDIRDSTSQNLDASVSESADVPLPLLGLRFDYHFTPRWSAGLLGEAFALDIDADTFGFSGTLFNVRLSTEYWLFNNVGIGAAINWFSLDVDVEDSGWKGKLDYQYWGPQVYVAVRF